MTLILGVEVPLLLDEARFGVVVPESAGVAETGRRLDIIPVLVRWRVSAGVGDPASS